MILTSRTSSAYRARCPVLCPMMPFIAGVKASTGRTRKAHDFPSIRSPLTDSYQYHNDNHIRR